VISDEPERLSPSAGDGLFTKSNTWRVRRSANLGWAIDGEDYFAALRSTLEAARHEILIVGWDIDSRVELIRDEEHPHFPSPLASTLEDLVDRKPGLRVFVLSWDFALVYVLERELLPARAFGWHSSDRLHFKLDDQHAPGASHHQKIVVVDGALAFSGGLDLTKCRWDTRAHSASEPRRRDPDGEQYRPFHDIQGIVSGEAAAALRELVSFRWKRATGDALPELEGSGDGKALWPAGIPVRARDATVGIARTWTGADGAECIDEVKRLYVDMISAARNSIYIENQYFTSGEIAEALAEQLTADQGPDIVIVLPGKTSGWLEQATMDILRNRAINRLLQADRFGRLRIVSPVLDEEDDSSINVHAKLMIVDGRFARIGSANLSRRSMSLDSECDLVFDNASAAKGLCADLLSEHLDADVNAVLECLDHDGLIGTIDRFNRKRRRLEQLDVDTSDIEQAVLEPVAKIADLEEPILRSAADEGSESSSGRSITGWLFLAALIAGLVAAVYGVVQLNDDDFSMRSLLDAARGVADHPFAALAVPPIIVAGSLFFAPVTGMIAICALVFDPWIACISALTGTLLATAVNHWLGKRFHGVLMDRVPDRITDKIATIASSSDVWTLAGLRLVPVAPFTAVNLVVGASGVSLMPFLAGTLIAMGPGIVLISLSVDRARAALAGEAVFEPWIVAGIAAAGVATIALRVWRNAQKSD
jgi:phosphatidylserine/phosphatidylglycerophosphate/cardiolipin synthase-like enzyme/uncharacterized membrane protein YdjX (TVP38/TMEM64 family)